MLVLSRRPQETVVIDGKITIKVIEVANGKARLGITAPDSVEIHRGEVQEAIDRDGRRKPQPKRELAALTERQKRELDSTRAARRAEHERETQKAGALLNHAATQL